MTIKTKRITALFLAIALIMCIGLTAFGADGEIEVANEDESPWSSFLGFIGAAAAYLAVFIVVAMGVLFFLARLKQGRRGY